MGPHRTFEPERVAAIRPAKGMLPAKRPDVHMNDADVGVEPVSATRFSPAAAR